MKDIYWKGHTILLLISLLCCFPDFVYAYSLRQFSNKNGLSNSAIQSLYQDSQGVLWIGTCDGLNVFDGNNIHLYTPVDASRNLLSGNIISQIVESEPGILWLQTNYGLDRLDTYRQTCRTFTEFKDNIFLARSNNKCMLVLKDDGNLYHYQQENQKFLQLNISSMDFNKVLSMTIDSNNLLWIFATGNNTRCYRLNHTGKSVTLIPEKPIGHHGLKHAFIGEDSAYFIDETYALYEYSFSNRQCYYIADLKDEIEKRGEVSSIIKRENDFCIGFKSSGLIVLKYEANQKIKYRIEYTEIQSGIFCLMKDKFQDIVWVATDGEGLYMLYNDTFTMTNTLLNTPAYQVNNPVRSLYLDPQQTLWIGTKGSGILRIPNYLVNNTPEKHDRLITGNSTLTDNSVYCFAPGGKDRLWIGTENGINYYSYSTHQLKELAVQANGTKVKYVHSIDQTNDSTLWISTVGEGIVKVTLENQRKDPIVKHATRTLVSNGHMASNYFFTSYRESSSTLWFGNRGLGAYRIDVRTGEMAQFRFNNLVNSQTANDVFAIHKNEQGYWLGTGSGLLRFYSNEDGNPDSISAKLYTNSTVHGILEDNRGNLWVSTNQGLMRLNPQEQTKQTYNNGNGLAVTEFSDGAFYKDNATGILFFGGVNGFVTVKPDSYITTDYMPEISLKGLSIFGKEYNLHDFLHYKDGKPVLQLDYKHNFFQLNFRITDYINGNDYFYSYKLKEASDQWIENGVSPNAIFSNLSPGEYTLFVKYRNNINGKESHPQAFTIYIAPPWYLSTWAYVGYFLLGLLLCTGIVAYAFYTYRLKRQHMMKKMERQKKEEVYESKLRFFTNISHEFRTPLTLIVSQVETLMQLQNFTPTIYNKILSIYQNSIQLRELITELLDFRKQEQGHMKVKVSPHNIVHFLYENYLIFMEYASSKQINFNFEKDCESLEVWYDQKQMQKVVNNLLSNAIKHTQAEDTITLSITTEGNEAVIRVTDTGSGIDAKEVDKIFDRFYQTEQMDSLTTGVGTGIGLALTKGIVELHHGTIKVESELGKGSSFIVRLHLGNAHFNTEEISKKSEDVQQIEQPQISEIDASLKAELEENAPIKRMPDVKMVIVEDNASICEMLANIFRPFYQVLTAADGEEGLELIQKEMPNIVVSDVVMPKMSGTELCKQIKNDFNTCHIPVVLLTARTAVEQNIEGLRIGADDYITKPFNTNLLISRCNNLVNLVISQNFTS